MVTLIKAVGWLGLQAVRLLHKSAYCSGGVFRSATEDNATRTRNSASGPASTGSNLVRKLMCQDTSASDNGFVALSRSQTIEYIWGRRCYNLQRRGFAALATRPALRGLAVSCKNVDDDALSTLPRFPALKELMTMDVPDDGFRHVGKCAQLEALWCMYCTDTGDIATGHLAGLTSLNTYAAFSSRITDQSLKILGRLPTIERLTFEHCAQITNAGLASLAALPRLREVRLEGSPFVTREGAMTFPANVRVTYEA